MVVDLVVVYRELLELMQAGTLEPEVAFLNASLVSTNGCVINTCSFLALVWGVHDIYLWLPIGTDTRCFPSSCCCVQDPRSKIERVTDDPHPSFGARLQLLGLQTCKEGYAACCC